MEVNKILQTPVIYSFFYAKRTTFNQHEVNLIINILFEISKKSEGQSGNTGGSYNILY